MSKKDPFGGAGFFCDLKKVFLLQRPWETSLNQVKKSLVEGGEVFSDLKRVFAWSGINGRGQALTRSRKDLFGGRCVFFF